MAVNAEMISIGVNALISLITSIPKISSAVSALIANSELSNEEKTIMIQRIKDAQAGLPVWE